MLGWAMIFGYDTKIIGNKNKNRQVELHKTKKLLLSQGNNQQSKRAAYRMRERRYLQIIYMIMH